jgi:hypothetical protein
MKFFHVNLFGLGSFNASKNTSIQFVGKINSMGKIRLADPENSNGAESLPK